MKSPEMAVEENDGMNCVQPVWAEDSPAWSRRTGLPRKNAENSRSVECLEIVTDEQHMTIVRNIWNT